MQRHKDGTSEWSQHTYNSQKGCKHQCIYCYACSMAVHYRKIDPATWPIEVPVIKQVNRKIRSSEGVVMYPSSHDLTPQYLQHHLIVIGKLLAAYPKVLLVSKPHLESVKAICEAFPHERERILWRFTIGSLDNGVLKKWEPGATGVEERLECLKLAHSLGFGTSVSMEPMLDNNPEAVVQAVQPYVTETIWLGKGNKLNYRVSLNGHGDAETMAMVHQLLAWQSDENIRELYQRLKGNPQIRWKRSIQRVVGLDGPVGH